MFKVVRLLVIVTEFLRQFLLFILPRETLQSFVYQCSDYNITIIMVINYRYISIYRDRLSYYSVSFVSYPFIY